MLGPLVGFVCGGVPDGEEDTESELERPTLSAPSGLVGRIARNSESRLAWLRGLVAERFLYKLVIGEVEAFELVLQVRVDRASSAMDGRAVVLRLPKRAGSLPDPGVEAVS